MIWRSSSVWQSVGLKRPWTYIPYMVYYMLYVPYMIYYMVYRSMEKADSILTRTGFLAAANLLLLLLLLLFLFFVFVVVFFSSPLFSQSQLRVQTLILCPYSPRAQSHASAPVSTIEIPNADSHPIVRTQGNTAYTGRNG